MKKHGGKAGVALANMREKAKTANAQITSIAINGAASFAVAALSTRLGGVEGYKFHSVPVEALIAAAAIGAVLTNTAKGKARSTALEVGKAAIGSYATRMGMVQGLAMRAAAAPSTPPRQ